MVSKEDFVRAFPAFKGGLRSVAQELLSAGRLQTLPAGKQIYAEGDACSAIAFVLSGEIRVFKVGETGRESPSTK